MRGTLYPGECYIRGFFVIQLLRTFYLGDRNFLEERYIPGNVVSVTDVISETNFIFKMTLYPQGTFLLGNRYMTPIHPLRTLYPVDRYIFVR